MADEGAPDGPAPDLRWVAFAVAVAGMGAVALASRGSGLFGHLRDGGSSVATTVARAALGAVVALCLAVGIVAVLRVTNSRHRLITPGPARPGWHRALRWSLPLLILLGAMGAAAGAATAPLTPREPSRSTSGGESDAGGAGSGSAASARLVDLDGDGEPDVDAAGQRLVALDLDGDGDYDTLAEPCPDGSPSAREPGTGGGNSSGVLLDTDCDGQVDDRVPLEKGLLRELGRADTGGTEAGRRNPAIDRSPDVGDAVRSFAILLLVAGALVVAYLVWRGRRRHAGLVPSRALPLPRPSGAPLAADRAAAAATVADALAAMLADPDPRTAIRAAYATLLDGLAAAGMPRRDHEAPAEHLERCLTAMTATFDVHPEPMRRLVEIFTMARFSTHAVGESHRADAVSALRDAQHDLAVASAPAAVGRP